MSECIGPFCYCAHCCKQGGCTRKRDEHKDAAVQGESPRVSDGQVVSHRVTSLPPAQSASSPRQAVLEAARICEDRANDGRLPNAAQVSARVDAERIRAYAATLPDESERDRAHLIAMLNNAEKEVETLRNALDTLVSIIGLTAIKYPEQIPPLQEAVDQANRALKSK